jgi:hypothetical protein
MGSNARIGIMWLEQSSNEPKHLLHQYASKQREAPDTPLPNANELLPMLVKQCDKSTDSETENKILCEFTDCEKGVCVQ